MTRRRLPVAIILALILAGPAGAGGSPLAKRLAKALAVPHVSQARTAAIAFDLDTGETLFADHGALSLAPASNEKLVVTYAALVGLGMSQPDDRGVGDLVVDVEERRAMGARARRRAIKDFDEAQVTCALLDYYEGLLHGQIAQQVELA
jgi:hypothetical protein